MRVVYDQAAPEAYKEPTERDAAGEWLLDYLEAAGKPVPPKVVIAAAKEAGFGRSTIYTAREELKDEIVNTAGRRSAGNCWRLASSWSNRRVRSKAGSVELTRDASSRQSKESKEFSVF